MPSSRAERQAAYDAEAVHELASKMAGLLEALGTAGQEAAAMVETLQRVDGLTREDQWARTWGETVSQADAARMLGVGYTKVRAYVADGTLATTPDGRVRVRDACRWAYGLEAQSKGRPMPTTALPKQTPQPLPERMRFKG